MLRRLALSLLVGVSAACIVAVAWLAALAAAGDVGIHWAAIVAIVSFGWVVETVRELRRRRRARRQG